MEQVEKTAISTSFQEVRDFLAQPGHRAKIAKNVRLIGSGGHVFINDLVPLRDWDTLRNFYDNGPLHFGLLRVEPKFTPWKSTKKLDAVDSFLVANSHLGGKITPAILLEVEHGWDDKKDKDTIALLGLETDLRKSEEKIQNAFPLPDLHGFQFYREAFRALLSSDSAKFWNPLVKAYLD